MRSFLRFSAAVLGLLSSSPPLAASSPATLALNALQHASYKKRGFYGPGRKEHKRLTDGTPSQTKARVTRQQERAEARADGKKLDARLKVRARDDAGKALSQRAGQREEREVHRRDARMTVHGMIEASRGAGRLQRSAFA